MYFPNWIPVLCFILTLLISSIIFFIYYSRIKKDNHELLEGYYINNEKRKNFNRKLNKIQPLLWIIIIFGFILMIVLAIINKQ